MLLSLASFTFPIRPLVSPTSASNVIITYPFTGSFLSCKPETKQKLNNFVVFFVGWFVLICVITANWPASLPITVYLTLCEVDDIFFFLFMVYKMPVDVLKVSVNIYKIAYVVYN